jgi:hypothetical protein
MEMPQLSILPLKVIWAVSSFGDYNKLCENLPRFLLLCSGSGEDFSSVICKLG